MKLPKLDSTFIVLDSKQLATQMPLTPSLYGELDAQFSRFAGCLLVAEYSFADDWPTWEMHPHGDEVLYLVSGQASLHLYSDGVERLVEFNVPGSFVVIPKGTWHTAKVRAGCKIVFVTPGEGTINGPDPRVANN